MALLVDSHCHLDFEPLGKQISDVLRRAHDSGVGYMLCVSVTLERYPQVLALARAHPNIFASVGVHPDTQDGQEPQADALVALAREPQVVAIGETGLDYYRIEGDTEWQRERFRQHIRAARRSGKPLVIHTRAAAADTLRIMHEEGADQIGGVMHCFTETWETARRALDLGFYISFSGIVTFKNAEPLRAVAAKVPGDRLLIETDAPYLAPVPHRGETNEPAHVRYVAEALAALRHSRVEDLAEQTTSNFFTLFRDARPQLLSRSNITNTT